MTDQELREIEAVCKEGVAKPAWYQIEKLLSYIRELREDMKHEYDRGYEHGCNARLRDDMEV
jgi:hypothetical protein